MFDSSTTISTPFYADPDRPLLLNVSSISTTDASGSPLSLLSAGPTYFLVDSSVPQIWLPEQACAAFAEDLGLDFDPTTELYLVNDSQHETLLARNSSITFTIEGSKTGNLVLT